MTRNAMCLPAPCRHAAQPGAAMAVALGITIALPAGMASAATDIGPYPFAVGDQFIFHYASTDSVDDGSGSPKTTDQSYTETTTIEPAVKYAFPPNSGKTVTAYPVQSIASSSSSAGDFTLKLIEYRNFVTSGSVRNYVIYGYSNVSNLVESADVTLHESTIRTFATPFILDRLPETTGAVIAEPIGWNQTIDNEYDTSKGESNVLQSKIVAGAAGAYTDDGVDYDVPYDIVQKADGTGTLLRGPANSQEEWSFARPVLSSKGDIIPVTVTYENKTGVNHVPDWYPDNAAAPDPLTVQRLVDKGMTAVPKGCGAYAGHAARLLQDSYTQLATVAGYDLDETDNYYVIAKIGRVCQTTHFTRNDYNAKTNGERTSSETFDSTLGLVKETLK